MSLFEIVSCAGEHDVVAVAIDAHLTGAITEDNAGKIAQTET
ncbi:hypothetical protein [Desulfofundulus sp. TPOSR]|nr:hypothetical protein [Desulfofundulus sp. TPOSR]